MVRFRKLNLKLLRDLKSSKIQFGAVALVVLLGVAMFIGFYSSFLNLVVSFQQSNQKMLMADYWISLDGVSQRISRDMGSIPGILAQGRLIGSIQLELDEEEGGRIEGRIISFPMNQHPEINDVLIDSGSYFSGQSGREVLLEKSFADYHQLKPGDYVIIGSDQSKGRFRVQGVVVSPEYLWVSKNAQEIMPSPSTFGVLFLPQPEVEALLGMEGLYNEINILVEENVDRDYLLSEVKNVLRKYGIEGLTSRDDTSTILSRRSDIYNSVRTAYLIEREDQPSYRLLETDLEGLQSYAVFFSFLFLGMAALTIYVLLNRLIAGQRVQIGLLRALSYGKTAVMAHYLGFALVVGLAGSITGVIAGHAMSRFYTNFYITYINLPVAVVVPHYDTMLIGALIGLGVPLIAGFFPAWGVLKLHPVESMRPPVPPGAHRALLERLLPFLSRLPYTVKLPFRNIMRNPKRSLFMALGITSAAILFFIPMAMLDSISVMFEQIRQVQRFDGRVIYRNTGSVGLVNLIKNMDGIADAEAIIEAPYRLKFGDEVTDTAIVGLPENSAMFQMVTPEGKVVSLSRDGVMLPLSAKDKLGVEIGDIVQLEPFVGAAGGAQKLITGFVDFAMGTRVFMPLGEAQEMLDIPGSATVILLLFDGTPSERLVERLNNLPGVATVEIGNAMLQYMDDSMGIFYAMIGIFFALGGILGLAIIFNGVTVNMLERRREIVTMRALGMPDGRITAMLTLENLMIGVLGIAMGIPIASNLTRFFFTSVGDTSDMMSLSIATSNTTYLVTIISSLVVLLVSQMPAIRQVLRLKLATATKDWSE
ncbi:MAG: FtsX-like permease family protein [Chloroflexota bacterium]